MDRKISMAELFVVLAATLLQSTFARTYTVGDSTGWQVPPNNADLYDKWADNKDFVLGNIPVFNFSTGQDAEVTEAAYDVCTTTSTIFTENNGLTRITLNRTGDHYISTFPGHCSAGQKLNVEVRNGTSIAPIPGSSPQIPAPTPESSPNTPTAALTPPNLATSLLATPILVFMSTVLVLLC